jgi:hypothetical protein
MICSQSELPIDWSEIEPPGDACVGKPPKAVETSDVSWQLPSVTQGKGRGNRRKPHLSHGKAQPMPATSNSPCDASAPVPETNFGHPEIGSLRQVLDRMVRLGRFYLSQNSSPAPDTEPKGDRAGS